MKRSIIILMLLSLVTFVTRAQSYSLNHDVRTTEAMTAALALELAQEEMTEEKWAKILSHYTGSELAAAGIFASKYLDRQALKDVLSFGSEENWYYQHIRQMVSQRIMPKIFNVASMMIKRPDKAIYWGPYLFKTTEEVKQLCMQFQMICSNGRLSFKDLHFLVLVDELKELFDLSNYGNIKWEEAWNNISDIGNFSLDDLEDDFMNLMTVGKTIASAGESVFNETWAHSSKVGQIFNMKPKEMLELGKEFQNVFEDLNSIEKIKTKLMDTIESTDSIGVTRLFKFDEYNINNYVMDYLHQLSGEYYKQRWYIYWHESGRELVDKWSPPNNDDDICNGNNGWYFIPTNDIDYYPSNWNTIKAIQDHVGNFSGWPQSRIDELNSSQSWYYYYIYYTSQSYRIYQGDINNTIGKSYSYDVEVYRSWNGGETLYEEEFDSYEMDESAFYQHMQSKLAEIKAADEAESGKDQPLHNYKIGKDSKRYYSATNAKKMRGCTGVEFWLNCDNGTKLAEGSHETKVNETYPDWEDYKEEAMDGSNAAASYEASKKDCLEKINQCKDQIAQLKQNIANLKNRQSELLGLIRDAPTYADAIKYQQEYNQTKDDISNKEEELNKAEANLASANAAYQQIIGDFSNADVGAHIPGMMRDCEVNYGVIWTDDGHWEGDGEGCQWVRKGKIESWGVEVTFRCTLHQVRSEDWLYVYDFFDNFLFSIRLHRSILGMNYVLECDYATSDQIDVMFFSNELSEEERSNQVNQRQQELMDEHPDCSIELRYHYSDNKIPEDEDGSFHLLWMSDRLRIAREVDMRLVRIHAQLVLLERYLRHSQSILDYLSAPFIDAYRQGLRGAVSNESYRRWRKSSIDALHSEVLDSIRQRRKPIQAPAHRPNGSSAALEPKEVKSVNVNEGHEN